MRFLTPEELGEVSGGCYRRRSSQCGTRRTCQPKPECNPKPECDPKPDCNNNTPVTPPDVSNEP